MQEPVPGLDGPDGEQAVALGDSGGGLPATLRSASGPERLARVSDPQDDAAAVPTGSRELHMPGQDQEELADRRSFGKRALTFRKMLQ